MRTEASEPVEPTYNLLDLTRDQTEALLAMVGASYRDDFEVPAGIGELYKELLEVLGYSYALGGEQRKYRARNYKGLHYDRNDV